MTAIGESPHTQKPPHQAMQFVLGLVLGQLVLWLGLGIPLAVSIGVSMALKLSDRATLIPAALGVLVGALVCAAIGMALANRRRLTWVFVCGAEAVPLIWLLRTIFTWRTASPMGLMVAGTYLVGGIALAAGFWRGSATRPVEEQLPVAG